MRYTYRAPTIFFYGGRFLQEEDVVVSDTCIQWEAIHSGHWIFEAMEVSGDGNCICPITWNKFYEGEGCQPT